MKTLRNMIVSRFLVGLFLLNGVSQIMATELVRQLPIQVKTDKDKNRTFSVQLEDRIEKQKLNKLLTDQNVVFVKTTDDKVMKLPLWQINEMPVLFKELFQQEQENSLLNPMNISQINGGISSKELELLSHIWIAVKKNAGLPFIEGLPKDSLSILNVAAGKVGSGLLYATTSDYLLLPEIKHKIVDPLIDPLVKLLQKTGEVKSEEIRSFSKISHKWSDKESVDRTKRLGVRGEKLLLYDIAHNFEPQEVAKITDLPSKMWYQFSNDGRMIVGIPQKTANSQLYCWDTRDHFKKYTISYSGFIGRVVLSSDAKTLAFTGSDQKVKFEKPATKLYVCDFTKNNPQPKQLTWVEGDIQSISFSPDGRKLACFSKAKLLLYDTLDNFKAKEVISDGIDYFIDSIRFDSNGTKFICTFTDGKGSGKSFLSLYIFETEGSILCKKEKVEMPGDVFNIDFDSNGDSCLITGDGHRLAYWKLFGENFPTYTGYYISSIHRAKLSPNGQIGVFLGPDELCFFYTDNPGKYYRLIKNVKGDLTSIRFSPDSKKCFILIEYPNRVPGYDPENTVKIDELTFDFGFQDLQQCNIGEAQMLSNLYYRKFMKHTFKNQISENIKNITKGTLSYELFNSLPVPLQDKIKFILDVSVVDVSQKAESVAKQDLLDVTDEAAIENLKKYLHQPPQKNIKHFQKMEEDVAAWKIDEIDEAPKTVKQETVMPSSKQSIDVWKQLSDIGERIYRRLPIWMQKWIKERKPTPEEKQYIQRLTDDELHELKGDFSQAKTMVKAGEAKEAKYKHEELEKAKEDMRRYFTNPRLYDAQGVPNTEAIQQTVATLKTIYQPGTLDYEAFNAVIKEMGFQ